MIKHGIKILILGGLIILSLTISISSSSDDPRRGIAIYQANCVQCHGENGDGNGPEAANLDPRPTDFTSAQMASVPDSMIEKAIVEGVPGVEMHSWGGILGKDDVETLIAHIRTFQK